MGTEGHLAMPHVEVRVTWPRTGIHADATEAVGKALTAIEGVRKWRETKEGRSYGISPYEVSREHFSLRVRHTVEPEPEPEKPALEDPADTPTDSAVPNEDGPTERA